MQSTDSYVVKVLSDNDESDEDTKMSIEARRVLRERGKAHWLSTNIFLCTNSFKRVTLSEIFVAKKLL